MWEEYSRYGNYCVYVGDKKSVMCHNDDTDIRIIDYRNKKNPNFEICDSYKITNEEKMINIISIISNYSQDFPCDNVGIFLSNINRDDVHRGDKIIKKSDNIKI